MKQNLCCLTIGSNEYKDKHSNTMVVDQGWYSYILLIVAVDLFNCVEHIQ